MVPDAMFWIVVFFIYGLAFFSMGVALAVETRRSSAVLLASSIIYLAIFALVHGAVEWADMFLLIQAHLVPGDGFEDSALRGFKLLSLAVSSVCLSLFAVKLITSVHHRHRWLQWVPLALFAGWLFSFFIPHLYLPPSGQASWDSLCVQCHRVETPSVVVDDSTWMTQADIWARYILYLPGSALASVAMFTLRSSFAQMRLFHLTRFTVMAAFMFLANAVIGGLVVPPAQYFPASILNYASFYGVVGVPPQVIRAILALAIAYLIIQISSVFEIQQRRQLERAQRERLEAQQRALESQQMAQQQLEKWNRELEEKVVQRTREVEQRGIEVAILEERDRIAREMHDSLGQILGYLGLKIIETRQFVNGGKLSAAIDDLRQMSEAVQGACADVRESILSLKTSISRGGLESALFEYVDRFGDQANIRTELVVQPGTEMGLNPVAEVQVLRIVQEALANVRKHAKAKKAMVTVRSHNGDTLLTVEDDGCGFDLAEVARWKGGHFGLQTMRERTEGIGGSFVVNSAVGQGTKIRIKIPRIRGGDVGGN